MRYRVLTGDDGTDTAVFMTDANGDPIPMGTEIVKDDLAPGVLIEALVVAGHLEPIEGDDS